MEETCATQKRTPSASRSPLTSVCSIQTCLPVESPLGPLGRNDRPHVGKQSSPSSRFFEELFCSSQTANTLVPLAGALVASAGPQSDVVKQGYLGKLERNNRRYFVLRAGNHTGPSRLEWYKSQEKFTAVEKSAGKAALFGSSKQGLIYLRCCLGVSRSGSSRKGHTVVLYAKHQTMVLVVEDQWEQEEWYLAIKKLMEEEQKGEEHGEGFDEEDDGYCTLPPAAFVREVWPVTVKPRGLGCSKSLAGESRFCLTATSLILIRVGACSNLPSLTIPLLSVRRFGHRDGSFFLELGRTAPNGPGEIWMEARDQGNPAVAQLIHETVRETVKALRALPDFSRSPPSNHNQLHTLVASKRCRPKHRDRLVNVRPPGSCLVLPSASAEINTSPTQRCLEPPKPDKNESSLSSTSRHSPLRSQQGFSPEADSYMEMKMDHRPPVNKRRESDCRGTGDPCGMESLEPGEEEERLGYMMMSPQVSHSSSVRPQDDYVTMASPQRQEWPTYPSHLTSFNSFTSDSESPLCVSHDRTSEHSQPLWMVTSRQPSPTETGQSQMSLSCSVQPHDEDDQERRSASQRRPSAQIRAASSPGRSGDRSGVMTPPVTSGPGRAGPVQAGPNSGTGRSSRLQAESDRSVSRYRLSLCLPSCLHAEDGS